MVTCDYNNCKRLAVMQELYKTDDTYYKIFICDYHISLILKKQGDNT